ncbi:uncharacterized protein LOC135162636 [Diachasmimorpha longicaudata]|uniref:uncharacterized protein LOC135162636 n=1 Tax=Diachasmimorpha longicaudata TaxID=58733 RepID=UPI0030B89F6B
MNSSCRIPSALCQYFSFASNKEESLQMKSWIRAAQQFNVPKKVALCYPSLLFAFRSIWNRQKSSYWPSLTPAFAESNNFSFIVELEPPGFRIGKKNQNQNTLNMKAIIIVCLLVPLSLGEKKNNLEDIEKDNLHTENHSHSSLLKPESDNGDVQYPHQYSNNHAGLGRYAIIASNHVEYNGQTDGYNNVDNGDSDIRYQVNTEDVAPSTLQPADGYGDSAPQIGVVPKMPGEADYQQHHLYDWSRAVADDQYRGIKTTTSGYPVPALREAVYIPASQLLAYSRNFWLNQVALPKNLGLLQHFSTQAIEKSPATVYKPAPGQSAHSAPKYIGYQSAIDPHPEEILPSKVLLTQSQIEYLRQISSKQANSFSDQTEVNHATSYGGAPVYGQGQAVSYSQGQLGHLSNYDQPKKLQYGMRVTKPVYRTQSVHNDEQRHLKISNPPRQDLAVPPVPDSSSDLHSGGDGHQLNVQQHIDHVSEPKSLLGSYIPSHIIAAQDAARYRERPLKLEGGFLPSKNFYYVYGKRKTKYLE